MSIYIMLYNLVISKVLLFQRLVAGPCYPNGVYLCKNGGRCTAAEGIGICKCIRGCSGDNCEICGGRFALKIFIQFIVFFLDDKIHIIRYIYPANLLD